MSEPPASLLVANRGEIALRILRAARELGLRSVALYSDDDGDSPHLTQADDRIRLPGAGVQAYLDIDAVVKAALGSDCGLVHPGYGFLSEQADFARACERAGLVFVGPSPAQLSVFGDKSSAIALAQRCGVPVMASTGGAATLAEVEAFFDARRAAGDAGIVIKAVGGGGGRGLRVVESRDALAAAYARCVSEARAAFGVDAVYAEALMPRARHIEVQVAGDGAEVIALGERDCTVQRRFQKLVEIAPSPVLNGSLRKKLIESALAMARSVGYRNLGTFEFLVDAEPDGNVDSDRFVFIEANPRLQVEHTVTEEVTGVDLVALQIGLARGCSLRELGLDPASPPVVRGFAIQFRVSMEPDSPTAPASSGVLERVDLPAGPGVRVDTHARAGYVPPTGFDPLLAKLIVSVPGGFANAISRARRALDEFRIDGVSTNLPVLRALSRDAAFASMSLHTRSLEAIEAARAPAASPVSAAGGSLALCSPVPGRLIECGCEPGQPVSAGQVLAVIEAMKMEHAIIAQAPGIVTARPVPVGAQVHAGQLLVMVEVVSKGQPVQTASQAADPRAVRPDLQRVFDRHALTLDAERPAAVARRRSRGQRTARENIDDLCDPGSFIEYGALAIAAQTRRRSLDDLIVNTPADGMVTGLGRVNGTLFDAQRARCVVMSYDATVLAGTQGFRNHDKTDRMLGIALRERLPVILFGEGGGGRPGDVDVSIVAGLDLGTFAAFAQLSGQVPVLAVVSGRCFAGNAALVGCADVIIATRDSNIGMGGPAMIEGGGLGVFRPEEIGPSPVQHANGVIDILVDDEAQAVIAARHYLSMFQGALASWDEPDAFALRGVMPENRLRAYDTRLAVDGIFDRGSVLWLRTGFGAGIHTALARIEGRPVGVLANNPLHLSGAIDADAADKAARFIQLCNAHRLPIVSLIDTPGFMVGPRIEEQAQVRHVCRMFVAAARLDVPFFSVVLRKGYGLGAMAMAAGGFHSPAFTVSWPTGEFGGMGLEGAVRLGYRKELEALPEGEARDTLFRSLLERQYEQGSAMNLASTLEIDAVIDPARTRDWLKAGLESTRIQPANPGARFIDTW
jgi:acetyl/propionyl-CoA carboxylase alpha subunit/acetyl-CoA carboxylase carboxyltransferase component